MPRLTASIVAPLADSWTIASISDMNAAIITIALASSALRVLIPPPRTLPPVFAPAAIFCFSSSYCSPTASPPSSRPWSTRSPRNAAAVVVCCTSYSIYSFRCVLLAVRVTTTSSGTTPPYLPCMSSCDATTDDRYSLAIFNYSSRSFIT